MMRFDFGSSQSKQMRSRREVAVEHAKRFIGKPYFWGGQGPAGFDCSGLITEVLRAVGRIARRDDYNAQGYYNLYVGTPSATRLGSLFCYGEDVGHITHIGMCIGWMGKAQTPIILEAAGGRGGVDTLEEAQAKDAMVTIRPPRSDVVAVVDPFYGA